MKLEGSKILVTGASSGIGAALAPILAERGAIVGVVARRADRLDTVVERCNQYTRGARAWPADLGDLARAVLPRMLERGSGQIVFVSSMGGRIPIANEAAYNAAKYAMCGFAEAMLLDLAGTG